MQLFKADGTLAGNVDTLLEFTYKETDIGEYVQIHCREYPPEFKLPGDAILQFISICEDSLLFRIGSKIEYHPEITMMGQPQEDCLMNIDGCFIGLLYEEDEDIATIITNAPNPVVFTGCCEITARYYKKDGNSEFNNFVKEALEYIKGLKKMSEEEQTFVNEPGKKDSVFLAQTLFNDGIAAVTCESEEEYIKFVNWLKNKGYRISNTVNPQYWDALSRYLKYNKKTQEVIAVHRPGKDAELILRCQAFLKH